MKEDIRRLARQQARRKPSKKEVDPGHVLELPHFVDHDEFYQHSIVVIRGPSSKWDKPGAPTVRKGNNQIQFVMAAIVKLFKGGLPPRSGVNLRQLRDDVREHLAKNADYCAAKFRGSISERTIARAIEILREDNPNQP